MNFTTLGFMIVVQLVFRSVSVTIKSEISSRCGNRHWDADCASEGIQDESMSLWQRKGK